ncbi:hypothetical protein [Pelistega ratti]|uniref:hypothetical protein n=1 Tax=Pelistega ratti TaxID=2652177 RepID=UPI00135B97BE|nr:hypothetical protein [Pelistega ratti]
MATKSTHVKAKSTLGDEISLSHSQTDSPVLDVNALERLHQFRPDIVDFIIEQTSKEAEFRRKEAKRINSFTFVERIGALALATIIGGGSIYGSIYAAQQGNSKLGIAIAVVGLGSLAVAFLRRNK